MSHTIYVTRIILRPLSAKQKKEVMLEFNNTAPSIATIAGRGLERA